MLQKQDLILQPYDIRNRTSCYLYYVGILVPGFVLIGDTGYGHWKLLRER